MEEKDKMSYNPEVDDKMFQGITEKEIKQLDSAIVHTYPFIQT